MSDPSDPMAPDGKPSVPPTGVGGTPAPEEIGPRRGSSTLQRLVTWALALACFAYLWVRISGAAGDQSVPAYLGSVFASVAWDRWLMLMVPYSVLFLLIDTLILWRVVNWFNAKIGYADLLPVRASAYILSIFNEQVGKGAIALYLNRTRGVPGWQLGSSMLFIMFCEFYYLLAWATLGYSFSSDTLPEQFALLPWLAGGAALFLVLWLLYFRGALLPGNALRDRPILHAFKQANLGHYLGVVVLRSPALLAAVAVYTLALRLFGVEVGFLAMLGYLPVIFFGAAIPTPMRAAAITLWVTLFPDRPAEMTAFGIVQHNFFIFFNAAIGLLFLRRANRDLFGDETGNEEPAA